MATKPCPGIPPNLLAYLAEVYPDRLPEHPETEVETARRIGQQDVIRKLRVELRRQEDNVLKTPHGK